MLWRMATHPPRRSLPVADTLHEHMALSQERATLMRQVAEARDAGKLREAQRLMKKTDAVHKRIKALEAKTRPVAPND